MATRAKGKVSRIHPLDGVCKISLEGIPADATPLEGVFRLEQDHDNYNALYSLALAAAVNRYDLDIGTYEEIVPHHHGKVEFMLVNW